MVKIPVTPNDIGVRLDRLLRKKLAHTTLATIYKMIRTGDVKINGKKTKENYRIAENDVVEVRTDPAEVIDDRKASGFALSQLVKTDFYRKNFRILYEDEYILACDKPPFLVVHPGSGHVTHDTLIDLATSYLMQSAPGIEPFLVHRIDKDTSGIVLLAKDKQTLRGLHEDFREHDIAKRYMCICHGRPQQQEGVVDVDLVKTFERNDGTKMTIGDDGLFSKSKYRVVRECGACSELEVEILTGRTHQIRVHMAYIGCPIVGDVRYGNPNLDKELFAKTNAKKRLYLHAQFLSFIHPGTNKTLKINSPLPKTFNELWGKANRAPESPPLRVFRSGSAGGLDSKI